MHKDDDPYPGTKDRKILFFLPLAHHRESQRDHCIVLPLATWRIACCARCLGLYPTLVSLLIVQGVLQSPGPGPLERWLIIAGIFPALFDWGLSWLNRSRGNNTIRIITGAFLGLSLGRSFWVYLQDPLYEILWIQIGLLASGAFTFELLRLFRVPR